MILFKTDKTTIDLSGYGVSLNEESALFTDNIYKSYSLPFPVRASDELWEKLGLPSLDNIVGVETKIAGKLITPQRYYNALLYIGEIDGDVVECNLSFGDEELQVYEMELNKLPWPIVISPSLLDFANLIKDKHWPETGYNFPTVYNPAIREIENYDKFDGFINNYSAGRYMENTTTESAEGTVYHNKNVMAPMPYLLEILRFGFAQEGRTISGPVVDHEVLRKVVYIPENFLEKFRGSEYSTFSFDLPVEQEVSTLHTYGIYRHQMILQNEGTYTLKFNLNLDPVTAEVFVLDISQKDPTTGTSERLYRVFSENNRVNMEKELKINVAAGQVFDEIVIELKLPYNSESISSFNQFDLSFSDGQLNEFPSYFSLADFMPDMTFGEYVNELKNWLNLDIVPSDNDVRIDFTQDSILLKPRTDHRHLEVPRPKKKHNSNRVYRLRYADGEQVYYNINGQIFSNMDEEGDDVIKIDMDVLPAAVERKEGVTTAVMPEERAGIVFAVYSGMGPLRPTCDPELIRQLFLQVVFETWWVLWLGYRINSKTFKESFTCSVHEQLSLKELSFKYNELHVIKKLSRKYISEELMKVDVESETF